ncbi:MAG TPA: NifB/NifX family molybdenum-iron cluster-binding protein [Symbiobacteriaceae bacterium]|nr:NifB/NifX family molybdenum-iron cluster-binding protein [Symbiobacteriaceae bacterium]
MLRFGIPMEAGRLSPHFGHAPQVALVDADPETQTILRTELLQAPPHAHGVLPRFLKEHGAQVIIAGGIGGGAVTLVQQLGMDLLAGAPADTPETLVKAYFEGTLVTSHNQCGCNGHGHGHEHDHGHGCRH